jgi:Family of unknown function (DUF6345)
MKCLFVSAVRFSQVLSATAILLLSGAGTYGQTGGELPVYTVVQSGALPPQAAALAGALAIPAGGYVLTNGQMDFIDPTNYLAAPVLPVTDPTVQSNLLADTVNRFPAIPIHFEQLNFATLNALTVPGSNTAVLEFAIGLTNAGLAPSSATPDVKHTVLMAIYTNDDNTVSFASNNIDTEVNFQFTLQGLPVVGPGAQVQVAYGPSGAVTRLHYAARQVVPGPMVALISPTVASNNAVALYGAINAQINVQLVYYAPPLSMTTVTTLIPWYLCGGTILATNPVTGLPSPIHLNHALIPATADPNYVPTVSMTASTLGGTQVVASAVVTGGTEPYSYLWSGSPPDLFTNPGSSIQYTPILQETPTEVSISHAASGSAMLSWLDPLGLYQMQSTPGLSFPTWTIFTNNMNICNEVNQVTFNPASQDQFFRLQLPNQPVGAIETVGLKIVDNNGVYVAARQPIGVNVIPMVTLQTGPPQAINWGTEAPYDQDFCSWDDSSWRSSMENFPSIFGPEQFDRGEYIALPVDFIAPPYGWEENVVDTAALVFYNGHGNPNAITFTSPYAGSGTPYFVLWNSAVDGGKSIGNWGSSQMDWMALLSCSVLAQVDDPNSDYLAFERWGTAFNGLHSMLGFETEAWAHSMTGVFGSSFETVFVNGMAGHGGFTLTMQQAWFHAAMTTGPIGQSGGIGDPAYLGPIGPGGVWDFDDFFWGMGPVGPTIRAQTNKGQQNIKGWFYTYETQ